MPAFRTLVTNMYWPRVGLGQPPYPFTAPFPRLLPCLLHCTFSLSYSLYLFLGDRLQNGSPYAIGPLSCLSVCLSVTLVYCGQMVGCTKKMKIGMQVGVGPGHILLDGDPAPPPQKGSGAPNFRPMSIVAKRLDGPR